MKRIIISFLLLAVPGALGMEREPLEQYRARRARLAAELGEVIVLFAARPTDLIEFQQEDNFYYLTGFAEPSAILLLDATGERMEERLFIPARDLDEERWTGRKLGPGAEAERETGIASVRALAEFDSAYAAAAARAELVYTLLPADSALERLRSVAPDVEIRDVGGAIAEMRQIKAETELALLEKAIEITMAAHEAASRVIAPGVMEYEVEGVIEYTFRRNGAERPAFPSIVGSGPFSTILHYDRNDRQMREGDLVVVDIGAEYSAYAADVTRTYPVSGRFTPRQREIYQIVLDAQKAALDRVRPGVRIGGQDGVHAAAREYIEERGYGEYFIHGTTHHIGLYVHDVGDMSRPLEPGMVITVEPGIYLPEEGIGVRIEDDVVVTETGYRLLSDFPKEPGAIETLMAR